MRYDPVTNNFTTFESVETPKVEIEDPVFGKWEANFADRVLDNGVIIAKPTKVPGMTVNNPEPTLKQAVVLNEDSNLETNIKQAPIQQVEPPASTKEYIDKYLAYAVALMKKYGIPASITLALGIIESNSGKSRLARTANNHFGIKGTYNGNFLLANDDRPNEKFRKYTSPELSFEDHSKILMAGRYLKYLRGLDPTDYRNWAIGIKKGGYATAPNYVKALTDTIERYGLNKYDLIALES